MMLCLIYFHVCVTVLTMREAIFPAAQQQMLAIGENADDQPEIANPR